MSPNPKIEITLDRPSRVYLPDEELIASFEIIGIRPSEVQAIEASVLWYTEGTGEEDLATHDFRRLLPLDSSAGGRGADRRDGDRNQGPRDGL